MTFLKTKGKSWLLLAPMMLIPLAVNGEIGFRRSFLSERLVDPIRFSTNSGFASVLWDTTKADTARADTTRPAAAPMDSIPMPTQAPSSGATLPESAATSPTTQTQPDRLKPTAPTPQSSASSSMPLPGQPPSGPTGITPSPKTPAKPTKPVEEPPAYHASIIQSVEIPVEISAELDSSTNNIVFRQTLGGVKMPFEGALDYDSYLGRSIQYADQTSWRKSVMTKFPTKGETEGGGISISIPVFKSKQAQRIFGGSDIGLSVAGNIKVEGGLRLEKREELQQNNPNPTSYQFKVNQSQQFIIKGKVGEKVSVEIDQDSERLFDFENNLKLRYQGGDNEIVKSVEAGNVSMSLGGASLVSLSTQHKGLFGFKTESRFGGLNLTTITSLKKGETQSISIQGGAKTGKPTTIPPYDYIPRRYYFLSEDYRENSRLRSPDMLPIAVPSELRIGDIKVYKSVKAGTPESFNAIQGWAVFDPRDTTGLSNSDPDQEHQKAFFLQLEPDVDFEVQKDLGYIKFLQQGIEGTIIGVAFNTPLGSYGDLDPSDNKDANSPPFVLKLLQPDTPQPTDSTWTLMWRNVYDLNAVNISREGFIGKITRSTGGQAGERPEVNDNGTPFIELFGLDRTGIGTGSPDGQIDETFIDFSHGELIFPDLQPFAPIGWYINGVEQKTFIDSTLFTPGIYTATPRELIYNTSEFDMEVQFRSVSATYELSYNVLEGSVEVYMNGSKLNPGVDYTVDYLSGELTILRSEALSTTATIEIKYETGAAFQTDTETLLGIRAEYELGGNSTIGGLFAYYNQKMLDQRVRVGGEPTRNAVWDLYTHFQFKPDFLTSAVDWLPLIETDKSSTFSFDAEVAQVLPNPNNLNSPSTGDNNGVAYIDDFESVTRTTPLGITMVLWRNSSFPVYSNLSDGSWKKQRGRTIWYNPQNQIKITDVWPDRQVQAQASTMPVLRIDYQPWWGEWDASPPKNVDPERSWGGVMRYLGTGYADQSQSKYLEIWINRLNANHGEMYLDMGRISEDVIPDGVLNTEDLPAQGFAFGDGILSPSEDVGLDRKAGADPADSTDINGDGVMQPSYDDWAFTNSEYSHINGTEGNKGFEVGRYPDTEDLDNDGSVDRANDFYRYKIDLSEGDANRYIVGGIGNPKGWRLYRIPLVDTLSTGSPSFTSVEYVRIWFTGFAGKTSVMIASMDIVGNEWQEVHATNSRGETFEPVSAAVINSDDNRNEYTPPPGVSGERDPVTNLRSREQSLVMRVNQLGTGEVGLVTKKLPQRQEMDMLEYRMLKMFVHGGGADTTLRDRFGRELDLEMFFRFGADSTARSAKYYEYSQRLKPGWNGNDITINFDRLASLKFLHSQDSTRDYDILPNGAVIRVLGEPSLSDIRFFTVGIKNHGNEITAADRVEIWVDELRLSDIYRNPGWAAKGTMNLSVAGDLLTLRTDVRQDQADFHSIEKRTGDRKDNLSGTINSTFQLDQFFNPNLGLKLPLAFTYDQKIEVPRYAQGSDVKLSSLTSQRIDIWAKFLRDLGNNDRFRGDPIFQNQIEAQISSSKSYSFSTSVSKTKKSGNPLLRYTLDGIGLRGGYKEDYRVDPNRLYEKNQSSSGEASYQLNFDKPLELNWLSWGANLPILSKIADSKLRLLPSSFSASADGAESQFISASRSTGGRTPRLTERNGFVISRDFRIGWRPLNIFSVDFSQSKSGSRITSDTYRDSIASYLVTLDTLNYYDSTGAFDRSRWTQDYNRELGNIKHDLFWKAFNDYFIDDKFSQSFSSSFSPVLFNWLGTESNYNARYLWNWSMEQLRSGGRSVGVGGTFSASATFRLPTVLQSLGLTSGLEAEAEAAPQGGEASPWMQEEAEPGDAQTPPPPDGKPGKPDAQEKPAFEEGLPGAPGDSLQPGKVRADSTAAAPRRPRASLKDLLLPVKAVAGRLHEIRWDFSRNSDFKNYAVGNGQAGWRYRLGLTQDPGLGVVPGRYPNSFHNSWEHKLSSGLDITRAISITDFNYSFSESKTISQDDEAGTVSKTVLQIFEKDKVTVKALPIVNWSVRWSGWEKLPVFAPIATSISLDHGFNGSSTEPWRKTSVDAQRQTDRIEYNRSFSPLVGMSFSWKGGVGTTARYNLTQRVVDERTGNGTKSMDQGRTVSVSASYTSRKGFRIPIPVWPFKNRQFKNNTSFSLSYDNTMNRQMNSAKGSPFVETNMTSSWSLKPSMEYSFSTTVRGGFHYEYAVQKSTRSGGTVRSQDFGFSVNISIKG